jgi:hypothetical protein
VEGSSEGRHKPIEDILDLEDSSGVLSSLVLGSWWELVDLGHTAAEEADTDFGRTVLEAERVLDNRAEEDIG